MPRTFGSLSAYEPGLMDKARWWLQDTLTPVMGGDARRAGDFVQNKVMPTAEYLPGVGDAMAAGEAVDYFRQGQPIFGTLAAAGAAAGLVPGVGDAVQKGVKKGIRAYHGSPHDFDKFSLDKIGTGEGAQAYGHGLYFAENEGIARSYRDKLAPGTPDGLRPDAEAIAKFKDEWDAIVARKRELAPDHLPKPDVEKEYYALSDKLNELNQKMVDDTLTRNPDMMGRMYEVNINADPNDFLDWDKPLSEQPEGVLKALGKDRPNIADVKSRLAEISKNRKSGDIGFWDTPEGDEYARLLKVVTDEDPQGSALYASLANSAPQYGVDNVARDYAAEQLRQAGIPGIKYLDAGSRSAGDGSRNYVVFDDALIEILRKYGLAGLGIGVGAGGFGSLSPQDDNYQPPQL